MLGLGRLCNLCLELIKYIELTLEDVTSVLTRNSIIMFELRKTSSKQVTCHLFLCDSDERKTAGTTKLLQNGCQERTKDKITPMILCVWLDHIESEKWCRKKEVYTQQQVLNLPLSS